MKPWFLVELLGAAAVVAAVVLMAQGPGPAAATHRGHWTIVDLGVFPRAVTFLTPESKATGLAESGAVVGSSDAQPGTRAFVWRDGRLHDLGTLGGASSEAKAIDGDRIVGWAMTRSGEWHAVVWIRGRIHDLGTDGFATSEATGFDARGEIVGDAWDGSGRLHYLVWHRGKPWIDPRAQARRARGGTRRGRCVVHGTNARGVSVGACGQTATMETPTRAFVLRGGHRTLLPMLPHALAVPRSDVFYEALFVNDRGEIAGIGTTRFGARHAVVWRYGR